VSAYIAKDLYRGAEAAQYDARRTSTRASQRKWNNELHIVDAILTALPARSTVLDLPCGTGRFNALLARHGCRHVGADISLDMLKQSRLASAHNGALRLVSCDAEQTPFADESFDYVLCMRFFNLIPFEIASLVLHEMARVSRKGVVVEIRCRGANPLLRAAAGLTTLAARTMRGQLARPNPTETKSRTPQKVFPLPELRRFLVDAHHAGLALSRMYKVGRSLAPNPLRICVLEHRRSRSGWWARD
jgi:ubiquinone/menaquinone biosynthesis C-methylase UbiE